MTLAHHVSAAWRETSERHRVEVHTDQTTLVSSIDPVRIRRVLNNLLSNAIKYSPEGGEVVLTLSRQGDGPEATAVLSVSDQGMGIAADALPHLFQRFYRSPRAARLAGGSGLGLAGARQIIEQHGGSVQVQSVEAHGSVFIVTLPLAPAGHL